MAVKTWAAGEVLTAADLNDTIADARGALAPRNLLYNGAMQVAQRGTSTASITTSGYYTADRWSGVISFGTWTQSVESDAPSGSGLVKSLKMLLTSGSGTPVTSERAVIRQRLEGQDLQRIAKGTASAQQLTFSFWVKSNVTGTYVATLRDNDNSRWVSASYSVSASATWEKKTITFPADTTGAFDNNNDPSLDIWFFLTAGTDYTSGTLATAWESATNANSAVGQVNLAAATNNYWQVTGVQLEVGAAATQFEFKPYGQELLECQRYYYRISPNTTGYPRFGTGQCAGTTSGDIFISLTTQMRAAPASLDQSGTASHYAVTASNGSVVACSSVPSLLAASPNTVALSFATASGLTAGNTTSLLSNNTTSAFLGFSAEL